MASYKVTNYSLLEMSSIDNDKFVLLNDFYITVINSDNASEKYTIKITKGAVWDGLSIPKMFRWFLPEIDYTNQLYSASGLVHDGLYASELLPKDIADDIFRSILRDSGISRFKGSIAHWCVSNFAKCHYGKKHDTNGLGKFVEII
jgi:hypothetical protein